MRAPPLASPRLRGEVGICALVAQILGEGAAPQGLSGQICACGNAPSPHPSPRKRGEGAQCGRAPCDYTLAGGIAEPKISANEGRLYTPVAGTDSQLATGSASR
jgi:hypothetical protein